MGLDLEHYAAIVIFGGLFFLVLGAFIHAVIVGNEPAHVQEFCPEGVKYLGANEVSYCQGKPFICTNKECYYVTFEQWEEHT